MRKLLLIGTALTAFSLAMPLAYATGTGDGGGNSGWNNGGSGEGNGGGKGHHKNPVTFDIAIAAALAGNHGNVAGDNSANAESQATSTSINGGSYNGAKGVSNTNQNAGANSALQNALALSYIQGCNCATAATATIAAGGALAAAGNSGEVEDNSSRSSRELVGYKYVAKPWADKDDRDDYWKQPVFGPNSTVAATIDGSFDNATGVFQVNQNSGDNSLLQNASAVAAATGLKGTTDLGVTVAAAGNSGEVEHNNASADHTNTSATINNSFNGDKGMVNANQNAGANSQLQNASALASLKFCGCAADNIGLSVAVAGNAGGVYGNWASAENGSNGASMTNSFNGSQGMLQANQNAGANSLLQNSVAVGVITH